MIDSNRPIGQNDCSPCRGYHAAMSRAHHLPAGRTILLGVLLTLTLVVRLVMPMGYMPADPSNGMLVTICSGTGAATIVVDLGTEGGKSDPNRSAAADCHFGTLAHGLAPGAALHLALPRPALSAPSRPFHVQLAGLAPARLLPPAIGPPARF